MYIYKTNLKEYQIYFTWVKDQPHKIFKSPDQTLNGFNNFPYCAIFINNVVKILFLSFKK